MCGVTTSHVEPLLRLDESARGHAWCRVFPSVKDKGAGAGAGAGAASAAKIPNKDAVEVSLDLIADTVVIKNITSSELNLEGWVIESETSTQSTTLPEVSLLLLFVCFLCATVM